MILPVTQAKRFCELLDVVTVYAHRRLHVVSDAELFSGEPPRGISEVGQRETCLELWEHPELLADFVRENPFDLAERDLAVVESWQQAFTSFFVVDRLPGSDGEIAFNLGDHACVVYGISMHLEDMLPSLPTVVKTTLLPFEDKVVYAMFMLTHGIDMGKNMVDMVARELADNVAAGRVVRTGEQFVEVAPQVKQRRMERELEELRHDIEMEERAQGPLPGQHRGVLAGLSEEEREKAIWESINKSLDKDRWRERALAVIDDACLPGEPVFTLEELEELSADKGDMYGMSEVGGEDDPEDVSDLSDPFMLESLLLGMSTNMLDLLRQMVQNDGQLRFSRDGVTSLAQLPAPTRGLVYYFHDDDDYVAVMPSEVLLAARQLDWDEIEAFANDVVQLLHFMETLAELRGIVRLEDAVDEYRRMYPNAFDDLDVIGDLIFESLDSLEFADCLFDAPDCTYLVHYEVMWEHWRDQDIDIREGGSFDEGELSKPMKWLLGQQRGKEPREVTQEMVDSSSVMTWACDQPPALGMRDFLDAHVPDECDDHSFADAVIEDLIIEVLWGQASGRVEEFFNILEDHGFLPDESQIKPLLTLWTNMCNGLPNWPNNGWSPNELHGRVSGRRLFFNADGSIMKVGRNDPCPCGSGKKYKRCCGRN